MSRHKVRVSRYRIPSLRLPRGKTLRILLISDLHGSAPQELLPLVQREAPDAIAVVGDLLEHYLPPGETDAYHEELDAHSSPLQRCLVKLLRRLDSLLVGKRRRTHSDQNGAVLALLGDLARLAPTFYAPGNHERALSEEEWACVERSGALYLDNAVAPWEGGFVCGLGVRPDPALLQELKGEPSFRILLCHFPEYEGRYFSAEDFDLVLCGHAHGGQIRLFGRGMYAPGQGFLPKRTGGVYRRCQVVGRGLCNTAGFPRLFNPLDLPVIELVGGRETSSHPDASQETEDSARGKV